MELEHLLFEVLPIAGIVEIVYQYAFERVVSCREIKNFIVKQNACEGIQVITTARRTYMCLITSLISSTENMEQFIITPEGLLPEDLVGATIMGPVTAYCSSDEDVTPREKRNRDFVGTEPHWRYLSPSMMETVRELKWMDNFLSLDLPTNRGLFSLVVQNSHNGYYAHDAHAIAGERQWDAHF